MSVVERRRLTRFETWCITSVGYEKAAYASARVTNVSWGGLGMIVNRLESPRLAMLLESNSLQQLRLGIIAGRWGTLRARVEVVRADLEVGVLRLGLSLRWAEPYFYDFVRGLAGGPLGSK